MTVLLPQASVPEADRQDTGAIYSRMALHKLQTEVPDFGWREYLQTLLHVHINGNEPVVVYSMPYVRAVGKILKATSHR